MFKITYTISEEMTINLKNGLIIYCNCLMHFLVYVPLAAGQGREIIKCLPYMCASVCHIFTPTFILPSFMKIYSQNLQRMFRAIKTCLKTVWASF